MGILPKITPQILSTPKSEKTMIIKTSAHAVRFIQHCADLINKSDSAVLHPLVSKCHIITFH